MKKKRSDTVLIIIAALLFAVLAALTLSLIALFNRTTGGRVPFDLDSITAERSEKGEDVSSTLMPQFIGIISGGNMAGISDTAAVMEELYRVAMPVISEAVSDKNRSDGTEEEWRELADLDSAMYIRYRSELADTVITTIADRELGVSKARDSVSSYIYEMFLVPSAEGSIAVTRSASGEVSIYRTTRLTDFTAEELTELMRSYRSSLDSFVFARDRYKAASYTEPVFMSSPSVKNILMTNKTSTMMSNSSGELKQFMRLFSMNPDKLLSSHKNEDGTSSYTDTHGILYLHESAFEYRAASGGGVMLEDILGHRGEPTLYDYLRAAVKISSGLYEISKNYAGGEADLMLTSVTSRDGTVSLEFEYAYDNIPIRGIEPAMRVTFKDGVLTEAYIYSVAVRYVGNRTAPLSEWWFVSRFTEEDGLRDSSLVYRSDFVSESVSAEWAGAVKRYEE